MEVIRACENYEIAHQGEVGAFRRRVVAVAAEEGLGEARGNDAALVASELASNVVKHGAGGGALLGTVHTGTHRGVNVIAWDKGPGMVVAACVVDGYSTAGTSGVGLGAVARLSTKWDAYSAPKMGSVVAASVLPRGEAANSETSIAGVSTPYRGETANGDGWDVYESGAGVITVIASDGLGHGEGAAKATAAALASFRKRPQARLADILGELHLDIRHTRGAAVTLARFDPNAATLVIAGVGNVSVWLIGERQRQLVTQHGTAGQNMPRAIREESYAVAARDLVVLHSDGLKTTWQIDDRPGLRFCAPAVIATTLWRDLSRGRDDATVVVLRGPA